MVANETDWVRQLTLLDTKCFFEAVPTQAILRYDSVISKMISEQAPMAKENQKKVSVLVGQREGLIELNWIALTAFREDAYVHIYSL